MPVDPKQPMIDSSENVLVIPVIQEFVHAGKQKVETGRVVATKSVRDEVADISVTLDRDEVSIERIPIGKFIESAAPESRYEGETLIIPVVKEELVIQKRLVLVEEIRISKRKAKTEFSDQVTLRKEEVEIKEEKNNELKT
jgi:uncharacterized protein (TIGR02271 family)